MISERRRNLVPGIPHVFPHPQGMAGCHRDFGRKPWVCMGIVHATGERILSGGMDPEDALEKWHRAVRIHIEQYLAMRRMHNPFIQFTLSRGKLPWWA